MMRPGVQINTRSSVKLLLCYGYFIVSARPLVIYTSDLIARDTIVEKIKKYIIFNYKKEIINIYIYIYYNRKLYYYRNYIGIYVEPSPIS